MRFFERAFLILTVVLLPQTIHATALDDYIAAPDSNYSYSAVNTISGPGYTTYIIDMTSQKWRDSSEVNKPIWRHWLIVIKPDTAVSNTSLLWISGGGNGGSAPTSADDTFVQLALNTNTVVSDLKMVPSEPLIFTDEIESRTEDEIIAYTFDKYLNGDDPNWPLLLPMTKSAVRAMDTITDHISTVTGGALDINEFVVSGASKRGWTTWLTAAVDSRVVAIAPAVIDVLDMDVQMKHHYSAYGFYSSAVHDYVDMNIFQRFGTPRADMLMEIVDPYEYRDRITIPKFLINSAGDQFFLPDSSQFFFDNLTGEKRLRYIPNTDHGLDGSAYESLFIFYQSILLGLPRPQFSWTVDPGNGSITVQTVDTPLQVNLWQGTNPFARDFRLETIASTWTSSPLADQGGGQYVGSVSEPPAGWTAFFVEMIYDTGTVIPYNFTTQVSLVPSCLPFTHKFGFDEDGDIDLEDLAILLSYWLSPETLVDIAPVCGDEIVNLLDYSRFSEEWLGRAKRDMYQTQPADRMERQFCSA